MIKRKVYKHYAIRILMKIFNNIFKTLSPLAVSVALILTILFDDCKKKYNAVDVAIYGRKMFNHYKSSIEDIKKFNKMGLKCDLKNYDAGYDIVYGSAMTKFKRGVVAYLKGQEDSALTKYRDALNEINSYNESYSRLEAIKNGLEPVIYYSLGLVFQKDFPDSAGFYLEKAEIIFKKMGLKDGIADCLESQGNLALNSDEPIKAREKYQKALRNIEKNNPIKKAEIYNKIAQTFLPTSDSCQIYMQKAQELEKKIKKCKGSNTWY